MIIYAVCKFGVIGLHSGFQSIVLMHLVVRVLICGNDEARGANPSNV